MDFQIGCLLLVDLQSAGFHPKVPQFESLQLADHESVDLQFADLQLMNTVSSKVVSWTSSP